MHATFNLTGKHTTPGGKAHAGSVVVTPNCTIRDTEGNVVLSGPEQVALAADGSWSLTLPCDSPGLNPASGIGYEVAYALHSSSMKRQSFYATADMAGTTLDVSQIVSVSIPAPLSAIVGPPGPPGVLPAPDGTPETLDGVRLVTEDKFTPVASSVSDRALLDGGSGVPTAVNLKQGYAANVVAPDLYGVVIVGGGQPGFNNVVGLLSAGDQSAIGTTAHPDKTVSTGSNAHYSVVSGYDNAAQGIASQIHSYHSFTELGTTHATISGGSMHKITKPGASNDYSTISGGTANTVSAGQGTIGGGSNNLVSGTGGTIPGGTNNIASGNQSFVAGGANNTASGAGAGAMGNRAVAREGGQIAQATTMFAAAGDQQTSVRVVGLVTTTATVTTLAMETLFPVSSSQVYSCHLVARDTATGDTKAWRIEGVLKRGASGAVVEVGGSPSPTVLAADTAATAWTVATLGGTGTFNLRVTGEASKTLRWVARFQFTEVA